MTNAPRPADRDDILIAFNQACPVPTAEQIIEWCERYPDLAADIRDHAAISRDQAARQNRETPPVDQTILARGFSRVLSLLFEAESSRSVAPDVQSFKQAIEKCGLDTPKLARQLNIDRNVLAALFNGRMLAPVGKRFADEVSRALAVPRQLFDALQQAALARPQLGHAKSFGAPTVEPQTFQVIVQESNMPVERKKYWLEED